ncbi:unnamed protein product [Owenia fusiformis]|uniref:EGF-like calcium-binding domain-containing protein n=1 Tax=Owenia fusiformis TaxID=6347 RepID=A0A8S4P5W7_OWEFU|nr:unnamed protein product [Owenia fusiformis]
MTTTGCTNQGLIFQVQITLGNRLWNQNLLINTSDLYKKTEEDAMCSMKRGFDNGPMTDTLSFGLRLSNFIKGGFRRKKRSTVIKNDVIANIIVTMSPVDGTKTVRDIEVDFEEIVKSFNCTAASNGIENVTYNYDAIKHIKDFNECDDINNSTSRCDPSADCDNTLGFYKCKCPYNLMDVSPDPRYPGRKCVPRTGRDLIKVIISSVLAISVLLVCLVTICIIIAHRYYHMKHRRVRSTDPVYIYETSTSSEAERQFEDDVTSTSNVSDDSYIQHGSMIHRNTFVGTGLPYSGIMSYTEGVPSSADGDTQNTPEYYYGQTWERKLGTNQSLCFGEILERITSMLCTLVFAVVVIGIILDYVIRLPYIRGIPKKYVMITGCDTGFGNICAKKCDKLGCNVFAACLTEKGAEELKAATSSRVTTFIMNVADQASVRTGYEFVKQNLPKDTGLWGIVNNAGVGGATGPADWLILEDYHNVCSVNLFGLIDVTNVFLPLVKKSFGRIVNTASVMGRFSLPGATPYSVSKFGVEAFSDGLRFSMLAFGVGVSIIEPGFFATAIADQEKLKKQADDMFARCPAEIKEQYGEEFVKESKEKVIGDFLSKITSPKIDKVPEAYCNALFSVYPRTRYLLGWDAWLFFMPISMLPGVFNDWLGRLGNNMPLPAITKKLLAGKNAR